MSFTHCPHCGARNFTMEGWEDLDHCSSCGKPLGEPESSALDAEDGTVSMGEADRPTDTGRNGANAEKPRPA